jgi:tetratricopeptide (TPR) repeat protein
MKAGDFKGAESDLTRAIESGERSAKAYNLRGSCKLALKDYEGAVADFTDAIERGGGGPDDYPLRGTARFMAGDTRAAVSDLSEETKHPAVPETLIVRGHAYFVLEAWENALRDFRAACDAGKETDALRCLIWLARAHAGERDEATRDLKSRPPKGWMGRIASYLTGATSEDDLLGAVLLEPESSWPFAQASAWYYIASRHLLDGREDPESFRKALKSHSGSGSFEPLVQGQLDAWAARDRRKLLDAEEARFRSLKRFHAEFRFRTLSEAGEEVDKENAFPFFLDLDRENERLLFSVPKGSAKVPDGFQALFEKQIMTSWSGKAEARRTDFSGFLESIDRLDARALGELDRIAPPEPGTARAATPKEFMLMLFLEGKPAPDREGTFRFVVGRGTYPCSWTRDGTSDAKAMLRQHGDETEIDLPTKKKRVVLDKAWGVPTLMEARDYDGKRRQLVRTSFKADAEFPALTPPAKFVQDSADALIEQMWRNIQFDALSLRFEEAVTRWERIARAGKEKDVQALFESWLAYHLDTIYQFNIHRQARQYIQWNLDQGQKLADLNNSAAEYLKSFKAWSEQGRERLETFMGTELEDLGRRLCTQLMEQPIDSRFHPIVRRLRKDLFQFDKIEAVRRIDDDAKADRIFREELEAARKL